MTTSDTLKLIAVLFMGTVWGLTALSRRRPDIAWLEPFRTAFPKPTEAQRRRMRRRANVYAGAELILFGVCLPIGYVVLTALMFNEFTPGWVLAVAATSLLCIGLGTTAIVRNRH